MGMQTKSTHTEFKKELKTLLTRFDAYLYADIEIEDAINVHFNSKEIDTLFQLDATP